MAEPMAGDDVARDAQAAHSLLFTLPDELLLNIAHCLPTPDQCGLSLVSKHIGAIAQEALYRAPCIPCHNPHPSRIAMLAQVLARNAHLACKVQQLDVRPHTRYVCIDTTLFHPWNDIVAESMRHLTVFMKESEVVGYILKHVPNLRHLRLEVKDEAAFRQLSHRTHQHLLGYDHGQLPYGGAAMSNVVGLQQLRSLCLWSGALEWAWCQLPHLTELQLGRECSILDHSFSPGATSRVKTLWMERSTNLLKTQLETSDELVPFFRRLPELEEVTFTFCNSEIDTVTGASYEVLKPGTLGSLDTLLLHLRPLTSTLRHLIVGACNHDDASFLEFISPVGPSLLEFQNLRELHVEHDMIVRSDGPTIDQILPPSLETLTIFAPRLSVVPYLEGLLPLKRHFSKSITVELCQYAGRGAGYEDLFYRHLRTWDRLFEVGIVVWVLWDPDDDREDWHDPNYDPFICEIIEFLAGLSLCRTPGQDIEARGLL